MSSVSAEKPYRLFGLFLECRQVVQERRLFPGLLALHVHDAYRSDADNLGAGCFRLLPAVEFLRGEDGELRALLCRGELQPEIGGGLNALFSR